jgi:protein-disulfide isomerase
MRRPYKTCGSIVLISMRGYYPRTTCIAGEYTALYGCNLSPSCGEEQRLMRISRAVTTLILSALLNLITTAAFSQTVRPSTADSQMTKVDSATSRMPEGISKEQADEILKELKAIHQLLERQQTAVQPQMAPTLDKVHMTLAAGWYAIGREDAPVTVVEFSDYECPFCRKFHSDTFPELKKNYIDTGKVRFISRDLPLDFHPNAPDAAMAARCAGEQNKFWEMRDILLGRVADLSPEALVKYATQINLDMKLFETCLNEKKYGAAIQKDVADARVLGIRGTPSFVVGKTEKDQIEGIRIGGAASYVVFEAVIRNQLNPSPVGVVPAGSGSDSSVENPR